MDRESFVRVYDDVLPAPRCAQLIEAFMACPGVKPGVAQELGYSSMKICDELFIKDVIYETKDVAQQALWKKVDAELFKAVNPHLMGYVKEFRYLEGRALRDEGFRFKRYPRGKGQFGLHIDQTPATPTRALAFILYLNDVAEGGETEFVDYGLSIKPKAGRLMISPPFWTHGHRGLMPISGDKFIVNNFACL